MQQEKPDDYVLATGETHTIKEFAGLAFKEVDMAGEWGDIREYELDIFVSFTG